MTFKILTVSAAILACALWPQGVILCQGSEGHVEIDLQGAECCPSQTDDCVDCVDLAAPDQASAPPAVELARPAAGTVSILPEPPRAADLTGTSSLLPPPRESALEGVVLLV